MNKSDKPHAYTIERLGYDNLTDLAKLHATVYGVATPHNFFHAKYDTAFTGVSYIGYLAYNSQKEPIAFYAVIPCFIGFEDKTMLAAQSADTMTHPGYRQKGLFVELALLTYELCQSNGIKLLFGFPNQNSLHGFINKLGWQRTKNMDCFVIRAITFSWQRIVNKISPRKGWHPRHQQRILKKYLLQQQGIANSVFNDGFAGVHRDEQYLKYKTYASNQVLKIGNSTFWVKIGADLLIGDILTTENEFVDVMDKLESLARKMGIKEIHFHANPGTSLHTLFSLNYNSVPRFPVIFKDLGTTVPVNKIRFTSADIDTF